MFFVGDVDRFLVCLFFCSCVFHRSLCFLCLKCSCLMHLFVDCCFLLLLLFVVCFFPFLWCVCLYCVCCVDLSVRVYFVFLCGWPCSWFCLDVLVVMLFFCVRFVCCLLASLICVVV